MARDLPSESEAREILSRRKTRPVRRNPPSASRALAPLIKQMDDRFGRGASTLESRWLEIVGERLARVTQPVKLTKGRGGASGALELRVVGAAALLVQHQSADILQRVNLFLGEGSVSTLRISQGPVKGLSTSPAKPGRVARKTTVLPAGAEADLAASVAKAPDSLRDTLMRLGRSVLSADHAKRDR